MITAVSVAATMDGLPPNDLRCEGTLGRRLGAWTDLADDELQALLEMVPMDCRDGTVGRSDPDLQGARERTVADPEGAPALLGRFVHLGTGRSRPRDALALPPRIPLLVDRLPDIPRGRSHLLDRRRIPPQRGARDGQDIGRSLHLELDSCRQIGKQQPLGVV